jgi:hypothetical protein
MSPGTRRETSSVEARPSRQTVARVFGSWNAAIAAAGFAPRPRGRQPQSFAEEAFADG